MSETENSPSQPRSETPPSSTSPNPTETTTPPSPAASQDSTGRSRGRPKGSTKKTTARKSPRRNPTAKKPKKPIGVDPGQAKPRPTPSTPAASPITVDPKQIKTILERSGDVIHVAACGLLRMDPDDFDDFGRFTNKELDDLAVPLSRIVQRHAALAVAAQASDELQVGLTMISYVGRNVATYRAAEVVAQLPGLLAGGDDEVDGKVSDVPVVGG